MNDVDNEILRAMSGPPSRFKREGCAPHHVRRGRKARAARIERAQQRQNWAQKNMQAIADTYINPAMPEGVRLVFETQDASAA